MPRTQTPRPAKLTDLPPGPDLILEGDGDFWHITDTQSTAGAPSNTTQQLTFSRRNLRSHPLSFNIDQFGAANKKIALSFDDGPDPKWTPKILDI